MDDIERARELLAAELRKDGSPVVAQYVLGGHDDGCTAMRAIAAALRAAPNREFRDPDDLAEYLGSLVSNDEEWDAAQAAMWGVRAFQGDATVQERLQAAIEGECGGLAITAEQATEILHYVLQPLYYADDTPTISTVTPPHHPQTKLGDVA